GRNDFLRLDRVCVQKLGRSGAGRSALAVVVPANALCHEISIPKKKCDSILTSRDVCVE
ncbi:MAG: hypothetical protein ACI8W3_003224, partial [Myxococcota bacterium]